MSEFKFYKKIRINSLKNIKAFNKLQKVYNQIPNTCGCLDNINKDNGCKGWCCKVQSPQFLYSEFLNLWKDFTKRSNINDIFEIVKLSLYNYIMGDTTKGCIFFDTETHMCKVHHKRGFNCRIYGITPDEEFKPRFKKMKQKYADVSSAVIKDQCNLVKTVNGKDISTYDIKKWWEQLINIEHSIGIANKYINDDMGGSYRTPHDHVLLYFMSYETLLELQNIRLMTDENKKRELLQKYIEVIQKGINYEDGKN